MLPYPNAQTKFNSNWLDLEVQCYQRKHQSLKILYQIVKYTKAFGIGRFCDINEGANLGSL
jgi:hypothetical protein